MDLSHLLEDHLPADLHDRLRRSARSAGVPIAEILITALEDRLSATNTDVSGAGSRDESPEVGSTTGEPEESEDRLSPYRQVLENSWDAAFLVRPDRTLRFLNERAAEMTGRTVDELEEAPIGLFDEYLSEADFRSFDEALTRVFEGRRTEERVEVDVHTAGHGVRTTEIRLSPVREGGTVREVVCIGRNVTERRTMERTLRESEEKFRMLTERSLIGVFLLQNGVFQYVNPKTAQILGRDREELTDGTSPFQVIHPADHEAARSRIRARYEGAAPDESFSFRVITPEEEIRHVNAYGGLIEYRGEDAIIGSVVDVTDRLEYERALIEAKEKAEEANRLKSAFLSNMSHEIRTPLASIIGFADLLSERRSEEDREFLERIRSSGRRLLDTLNSVLDLAQLESRTITLRPETIDVRSTVEEVLETLAPMVEEKDLHLRAELPDEEAEAYLDRGVLTRILTNLAHNAIKFTDSGTVRVSLSVRARTLHLEVADTGIGIPEDDLTDLFRAFHQESTGLDRDYEGSGLGLTITRKLVRLAGGSIEVESERGTGTRFTVRLPRFADAEESPTPSRTGAETDRIRLPDGLSVVFVDDDPAMRELVVEMCPPSWTVDALRDGGELIDRLEEDAPLDLLLMDVHLGEGETGTELLGRLRGTVPESELPPVVAVTAYAMPEDEGRFLEEGFDGYIAKPFTRRKLLETLSRVL